MNYTEKKSLYESIMNDVARSVKRRIVEAADAASGYSKSQRYQQITNRIGELALNGEIETTEQLASILQEEGLISDRSELEDYYGSQQGSAVAGILARAEEGLGEKTRIPLR